MIIEQQILKNFFSPHISEKSSIVSKKRDVVVIKVPVNVTKFEIKQTIQKLFKVKVNCINTLIVQGKKKRKNGIISRLKNWKKAYIFLKKGQNVNFIGHEESTG
ncbi:MAG: 50S ribosomal protein L23 [Buchnera aphidicola (Nurudea yanoniella)]